MSLNESQIDAYRRLLRTMTEMELTRERAKFRVNMENDRNDLENDQKIFLLIDAEIDNRAERMAKEATNETETR